MDPLTGAVAWSKTIATGRDVEVWGSPNFSPKHDRIYVATCSCSAEQTGRRVTTRGAVVALDANTGDRVWDAATTDAGGNGGQVRGGPALYDPLDRVYVATDHAYTRADPGTDALLAFDAATGARAGGFQATPDDVAHNDSSDPTRRAGFAAAPNLLSSGGRVLVGAGAKSGTYHAVDAVTMAHAWSLDIGPGSPEGGIRWGAAWDGKRVLGSAALPGQLFGIQPAGVLAWRMPAADPFEYGPVSVSRGVVWATDSLGFVNTHEASSGRLLGRQFLGSGSTGGVSFAGGRAFVAVGSTGAPGSGGVAAFK
jgi:polyvinyl alcohol dehydrogenase (cytochrome)